MKTENAKKLIVERVNRSVLLSFAIVLVLTAVNGRLSAQADANEFVPFQQFLSSTAASASGDYMSRPGSRVQDAASFDEMRRYILTLYQGVQVGHSMIEGSQYFDCVPVAQQPTARLLGISEIDAPPAEMPPGLDNELPPALDNEDQQQTTAAVDSSGAYDRFGNPMRCEQNTIPMRRLTLDELTQYVTLSDFLARGPKSLPLDDSLPPAAGDKRYATELQTVDNIGAVSEISLWDPPLASNGNEFSLAQQWISGGTGDGLQTIEGGWTKYPAQFDKKPRSVLFIFFTSKNYQKGFGCYNLECPGFVQTDESWKLAGEFPKYSVSGGEQHWFSMEWYFVSNGKGSKNWWLLLKHDNDAWKWVGYYPEKVFDGGQLSKNASEIQFGGEVDPDSDTWPFMGSGAYPDKGWTKAAYQSNVKYTDLERNVKAATLRVGTVSANCYKVDTPMVQNPKTWGTYFFFGGPGGKNCN